MFGGVLVSACSCASCRRPFFIRILIGYRQRPTLVLAGINLTANKTPLPTAPIVICCCLGTGGGSFPLKRNTQRQADLTPVWQGMAAPVCCLIRGSVLSLTELCISSSSLRQRDGQRGPYQNISVKMNIFSQADDISHNGDL